MFLKAVGSWDVILDSYLGRCCTEPLSRFSRQVMRACYRGIIFLWIPPSKLSYSSSTPISSVAWSTKFDPTSLFPGAANSQYPVLATLPPDPRPRSLSPIESNAELSKEVFTSSSDPHGGPHLDRVSTELTVTGHK